MPGVISWRTNESDSIFFEVLGDQILHLSEGIFIHSK